MSGQFMPKETPEEHARRFCYAAGWNDEGDTRVMFRNGGIAELPELLSDYAGYLMKERDVYQKVALDMLSVTPSGPIILNKGVDAGSPVPE